VLTDGIDHVATITNDGDRFIDFYTKVFQATVEADGPDYPGVFEVEGNTQTNHQRPMFGRGRLDHIGFHAADLERFGEIRRRLMAEGATDGVVTEFGRKISLFFRDPDLLECEVPYANPDADREALSRAWAGFRRDRVGRSDT
jgi:catechol 2,3-dioxygenase-like lactoylglutathione lyase family enzyme